MDPAGIDTEVGAVVTRPPAKADGSRTVRSASASPARDRRGLAAIAQLSGINAIMYYSTRIFTTAGVGVANAFTATVVVGLINLVFTLLAVSLMTRGTPTLRLSGSPPGGIADGRGVDVPRSLVWHRSPDRHTRLHRQLRPGTRPHSLVDELGDFPGKDPWPGDVVAAFTVWVIASSRADLPDVERQPFDWSAVTFGLYAAVSFAGCCSRIF